MSKSTPDVILARRGEVDTALPHPEAKSNWDLPANNQFSLMKCHWVYQPITGKALCTGVVGHYKMDIMGFLFAWSCLDVSFILSVLIWEFLL